MASDYGAAKQMYLRPGRNNMWNFFLHWKAQLQFFFYIN